MYHQVKSQHKNQETHRGWRENSRGKFRKRRTESINSTPRILPTDSHSLVLSFVQPWTKVIQIRVHSIKSRTVKHTFTLQHPSSGSSEVVVYNTYLNTAQFLSPLLQKLPGAASKGCVQRLWRCDLLDDKFSARRADASKCVSPEKTLCYPSFCEPSQMQVSVNFFLCISCCEWSANRFLQTNRPSPIQLCAYQESARWRAHCMARTHVTIYLAHKKNCSGPKIFLLIQYHYSIVHCAMCTQQPSELKCVSSGSAVMCPPPASQSLSYTHAATERNLQRLLSDVKRCTKTFRTKNSICSLEGESPWQGESP